MGTTEEILSMRLVLAGEQQTVAGINQVTGALGRLRSTVGIAAGVIAGVGGIAASLGFVASAAKAAASEQASFERAARNFKGGFPLDDLNDWAGQLSDLTAIDDGVIAGMAGVAGSFGLTASQAKLLVAATLNAKESLKELGGGPIELQNAVTRAAVTGSAGNLTRMGLPLDEVKFKAASLAERLVMLQTLLNSQGGPNAAAAWAKTAEGRLAGFNVAVGNLQEDFGALSSDFMGFAAGAGKQVIDTFLKAPAPLKTVAYVVGIALPLGLGALSIASSIATIRQASLTTALVEETLAMNAATAAAGRLATAQGTVGATGGGGAGGGMGWKARLGGAAATAAGFIAASQIPDNFLGDGIGKVIRNDLNGIIGGAGAGYQLGGIPGAIAGGLLGGIGAAGSEAWRTTSEAMGLGKKDDAAEALKQIAANTAQTAANTDPSKLPLSTSDMPGARQVAIRSLKDALA